MRRAAAANVSPGRENGGREGGCWLPRRAALRLHVGGCAAGSFLSGTSRGECNPAAAEKALPFAGGRMHASPASPLSVRTVEGEIERERERGGDLSGGAAAGHGLLLSPFCRESIAGRVDVTDTACLLL